MGQNSSCLFFKKLFAKSYLFPINDAERKWILWLYHEAHAGNVSFRIDKPDIYKMVRR
jgi:hypothetical protein